MAFLVDGMSCAACVRRVDRVLRAQPGVGDVSVNILTKEARVVFASGAQTVERLTTAVVSIGYKARPIPADDEEADEELRAQQAKARAAWIRLIVAAVLSAPVVAISMAHVRFAGSHELLLLLSTPVVFWCGAEFFRTAWAGAKHGSLDMNTLIALGTGAAWLQGLAATAIGWFDPDSAFARHVYFEAAAAITTFVLAGRMMEERARHRTMDAIQRLRALKPTTVRVLRKGEEVEIPASYLEAGDTVLLKPGERVPADGVIAEGTTTLDEALLTGESIPVDRGPGGEVAAGTLNLSGAIRFRAERVGAETTLAGIVKAVREAQASRAPIARLADTISGVFVPVVLVLALGSAGAWLVLGPEPAWAHALNTLVSVLIIACPCALGLATPTAIVVGTGRAAESGILVRGGEALERAAKLKAVVFDKTGTLTTGRPAVRSVVSATGVARIDLLRLAASAERDSEHPLSRAILDAAQREGLALREVSDFRAVPGRGISARVEGQAVLVGNAAHFAEAGIDLGALVDRARASAAEGATPVFVAVDGKPMGFFALADTIREDARQTVAALRARGLKLAVVSGDHAAVVQAVGKELGIEKVLAECSPLDKARHLEALRAEWGPLAFIGDGLNDAPALAKADVGITVAGGTDVARGAAHVTLLRDDLHGVIRALDLSRATFETIRTNLALAFAYNVIALPIAMGALYPVMGLQLHPMVASAAMAFSSLSVVSNSLRLRGVLARKAAPTVADKPAPALKTA